jgi:acyl dehydratase
VPKGFSRYAALPHLGKIMTTITAQERSQQIGREIVSDWVTVSQEMIDKFADATGDHQFIHIDPEKAKLTPFGGTVAHGFLTLSLIPLLASKLIDAPTVEGVKMGVNYGGNKVRFIQPVRSGKRVRGRFVLTDFSEKRPGQWQQVNEITIEIEDEDKPAMIAEWIGLIFV